jgi:predicted permease
MFLIVLCGTLWSYIKPANLTPQQTRLVVTNLVYYLFLPALVLNTIWHAKINANVFQYSFITICSISFSLACVGVLSKVIRISKKSLGAMFLAAAFPNVTYLGLPVLENSLGQWTNAIVIQIDLFATTPFLFTVGVFISRHYGEELIKKNILLFFNTPLFWSLALALVLNFFNVSTPEIVSNVLTQFTSLVAPLMIFSLGLTLNVSSFQPRYIYLALPVLMIKLMMMPYFSALCSAYSALEYSHQMATILDLGMPSMLLGIVFCEHYKLNTALYATAAMLTTLCSMLTLPFWHHVLTQNKLFLGLW